MLIQEGKISEDLAGRICYWPHSGFNIHNEVEINANDEKGKVNLAQYNLWHPQAHSPPVSEERIIEDVVYDYAFFDSLVS